MFCFVTETQTTLIVLLNVAQFQFQRQSDVHSKCARVVMCQLATFFLFASCCLMHSQNVVNPIVTRTIRGAYGRK